ncbi:serine/threonine-protein phosphatase 2A regulatory subunit B'' subunit beta-like isoform X2 [Dysidea avara]|uniref:serine/threonine-protein phosphatase 2A regulatory subunit B'' subunit beta-like isoform X2 n=1 Tax=Dysidea avara TaxID=196820 RepID=UPI003324622E
MQSTRTIPVADPSQKSKELFLYWLSLSETQCFLRSELGKLCPNLPRTAIESLQELDNSPNTLTRPVSPPPNLSKSPRGARGLSGASPKRRSSSKLSNSSSANGKAAGDQADYNKVNQRLQQVPKFYYPNGKKDGNENHHVMMRAASAVFQAQPNGQLKLEDFPTLMKACKLPVYWKAPLFNLCCGMNKTVDMAGFKKTWTKVVQGCHDAASRFVYILTKGKRRYLVEDDFTELIQDVVNTHPGLACLTTAPEFHSRYIETVIARIFYTVSKSWNFKITLSELRKSNFLEVLSELDKEEDINQELYYFSYEHFYVIYCNFWDLDTDHDCIIDADDLSRHANGTLLPTMVKQLMSGAVTRRSSSSLNGVMSYKDFVWFLLSEEDKTTPRSVHTFRPLKSGLLTNKDTLIIRTLVHGPICISVHTFRPLKSGHVTNQDTSTWY